MALLTPRGMEIVQLDKGTSEISSRDQEAPRQLRIRFSNVSKTFQARGATVKALENVDFSARDGEFIAIVGRSGCGKSTLLRLVAGLISPSSGEVWLNTSDLTNSLGVIGKVFQSAVLLPWRTVMANVMLPVEIAKADPKRYRQRAEELIRLTGLEGFENRYPHELSGGMQQRVSLCRALVGDPPILLMDEPFGALDAFTRDKLNLQLQEVWMQTKKTVIFVTHSIAEAVFLADRVVVMSPHPGRVQADIPVALPRPREISILDSVEFVTYSKQIRDWLDQESDGPGTRTEEAGAR